MWNSFVLRGLKKKLFKAKVELGGVQAEMAAIDTIVKGVKGINNGQMDRTAQLGKRGGELHMTIALLEKEIQERTPVRLAKSYGE